MTILILSPEQARACLDGTHFAGKDGRPIPTAGWQLLKSHDALAERVGAVEEALRQIAGLSPGAMEEAVDIANSVLAAAATPVVPEVRDHVSASHAELLREQT